MVAAAVVEAENEKNLFRSQNSAVKNSSMKVTSL